MVLTFCVLLMVESLKAQHGTASNGYFPMGYSGDTWTGEVSALDEAKREITLVYKGKKGDETFVGVLQQGYHVKLKDGVVRVKCECCGNEKKRVWGFVSKFGDAHAVYYALLNVTEDSPRVGLTVSIGPWWEGTEPSQSSWCHIDIRTESDKFQFVIRDPKESNFYPWERGGASLSPQQAAANGDDRRDSVSHQVYRPDRPGDFILSG